MIKHSVALLAVLIHIASDFFAPTFFTLHYFQMLDFRCHLKNYCFQEFCNGEGRRKQRLSSISWEEKKEHKGLKRGFHFYHMPYCVNICISLLKVFRRWAGHQLLVSCSSSRHLLPQSINQSVQRDILPLLGREMQTTALTEIQW